MASERGFSRRKFISSKLARGGSVLWAPTVAPAGGSSVVERIAALRAGVASSKIRDERLLKSMLSKLGRAEEAVKDGNDVLACSLLKKFIQVTSSGAPSAEKGLTLRDEHTWKQEARDIRGDLGCDAEAAGSVGH